MSDYLHIQHLIDAKRAAWAEYGKEEIPFATVKALVDAGVGVKEISPKLHAAHEATAAVRVAQNAVCAAFAAERGWKVARFFSVDQLRRASNGKRRGDAWFIECPIDHGEYFRVAERPWRPIAIVSHEYSPFANSLELADRKGLTTELLPSSWYWPGHCNAVLYKSKLEAFR